jgi:glycosyltransferase involved in cell wall biosynthesis
MRPLRAMIDARFLRANPHSSHARYLRALVGEWADRTDGLQATLFGTGARPDGTAFGPGVRWQAPALPVGWIGERDSGARGRLWLNTVFTLAAALDRPDVLFFPWPLVPKVLSAPSVVMVHDVCFRSHAGYFSDGGRNLDQRVAASIRSASEILTPSAATKDGVVAAYGVDPSRVTVVHHGVDPVFGPNKNVDDATIAQHVGLATYFLCISAHEQRKNLALLVRAFVELLDGLGEARELPGLVLVGKANTYTDTLRQLVNQSPRAAQATRFLQGLADTELASLYRCAAAVVFPSVCEGFGFPMVESLASGTPVIVSDLAVFRELGNGLSGVTFVPPFEQAAWTAAMLRVLEDPGPRDHLQRQVSQVGRMYSWHVCAETTRAVLERVARRGRTEPRSLR